MWEPMLERNHTSVSYIRSQFLIIFIWIYMWEPLLEINHTNASYLTQHFCSILFSEKTHRSPFHKETIQMSTKSFSTDSISKDTWELIPTKNRTYVRFVINVSHTQLVNLKKHRRTHATEKQNTFNKPFSRSSSSAKQFQFQRVIQPQYIKVESEWVATISQDENRFWKNLLDVVFVMKCLKLRKSS